jgi:hypothetical protein
VNTRSATTRIGLEADADLASLDPRCLSLLRRADLMSVERYDQIVSDDAPDS